FGVDDAGKSRAATMEAYGIGSRGDHVGMVWEGECYDLRTGWSRISGPFGVTFGSANVAVQILLRGGKQYVKANSYRDGLLESGGERRRVEVTDFADLVCTNRPQWLIDYVESEAHRNVSMDGVKERLAQFLRDMRALPQPRPEVLPLDGDDEGE